MKVDVKSEFGKGFVVCLSKFYQHFGYDSLTNIRFCEKMMKLSKEDIEKVISGNPPANLNYGTERSNAFKFFYTKEISVWGSAEKAMNQKVSLWANGASDHLYEIEVPKGKRWDRFREPVKKLQNIALDMGHGAGLNGTKLYTLKNIDALQEVTEELLLLIDMMLGLKADWGE